MSEFRTRLAEATIYDGLGRRKYLTGRERKRFFVFAKKLPLNQRTFCLMFYYTGLRISEALNLTAGNISFCERSVVIRTLKRRTNTAFRVLPLPESYLKDLRLFITADLKGNSRLWTFSRKTGYRLIKEVMANADIHGPHACPKGLRHGFGIACVQSNIPLPTISRWMGHSSIHTTAIYLNVVGEEERNFAKRIW